jgi:hypothetical protein
MVKQRIVLGHVISHRGIKVDKVKVDMISILPPPCTVKEIRSFLMQDSTGDSSRIFSKIARPLCKLLVKETPFVFVFDEDYKQVFGALKKILTSTLITQLPN